jgi:voltage-gated potassium channel
MFPGLRTLLREREGKILVWVTIGTIAFGTVAYMWLEGWSAIDALYFSVVALATVGFGDLVPTTDPGKLFTVAYILFGIGILAAFASELTKDRRAAVAQRMAARRPTEQRSPDGGPEA